MLSSGYDYKELSVLYVDDETQALKYFVRGFSPDFDIETAANAGEAWSLIQDHGDRIGVLVTDQRMPGLSGTDLMRQVQREYPHIVRILVTGYSDLDAAVQAVNAGGVFRYISKPWDSREFRGILLRAMEFAIAQRDRNRLLQEKLYVLQRIGMMDRVRGLAVLAAALQGRLRNPLTALAAYLEQAWTHCLSQGAPLNTVRFDADLRDWNRTALAHMLSCVQQVTQDVSELKLKEEWGVASELAGRAVDASAATGVTVKLDASDCVASMPAIPPLFLRMLGSLIRAADYLNGGTSTIHVRVAEQGRDAVSMQVASEGDPWTPSALTRCFSAAFLHVSTPPEPACDLLSAFLVAQHHEGTLRILPNARTFELTFRQNSLPSQVASGTEWIDEFLENLQEWEP